MNIETVTTILIAITPAFASIAAIVGGIVKITSIFKRISEENAARLEAKTDKMEKVFKDMAILKTKVESVEKYLLENKGAGRK